MKVTLLGLLAVLFVLAPGATARAQSDDSVSVTVPFAFHVGEKAMPAGDYDIELSRVSRQVIFRTAGTKRQSNHETTGQILTRLGPVGKKQVLVFDRRGEEYLLSEVWFRRDGFLIQGDYGDIDHQHRLVRARKPVVAASLKK